MGFETGAGEFMQNSNAGTYNAAQMRRSVFAWAARTSANTPGLISGGLLSATDMQLSNASSGLVVNTSVGECLIPGSEATSQGGYHGFLSSTNSTTLATANGSNPRIDLICATAADPQYTIPSGGSSGFVTIQAVTGTPTAGANLSNLSGAPSPPLSSLLLGYVLVPAAATNLSSGDILNVATVVRTNMATSFPGPTIITGTGSVTVPLGAGHAKVSLVAGGGGGGGGGSPGSSGQANGGGGGGGAGQAIEAIMSLSGVSGLTATIGAGGSGGAGSTAGASNAGRGTSGGNTELAGTGLTTITAYGGGGGGAASADGAGRDFQSGGVGGAYGGANDSLPLSSDFYPLGEGGAYINYKWAVAALGNGGWGGGAQGGQTSGTDAVYAEQGGNGIGLASGGGSGGGSNAASGISGDNSYLSPSTGGQGTYGTGGGGGPGSNSPPGAAGDNATGYGGGGGGGGAGPHSAAGGAGGAGSAGLIVIEWLP